MDIKIPDITKLTWPLNVALAASVFSIFALIFNPYFIYYGFLTFLYGILCHLVDTSYNFWLKEIGIKSPFVFVSQLLLTAGWILLLLAVYK